MITLQEALDLAPAVMSAIGGLAGVVFWIYKKCIKPTLQWGHRMSEAAVRVNANVAAVEEVKTKVGWIQQELQYNGGGSLRDMVSEIHARVVLSQQFDRALADSLPYVIWHADEAGNFLWTNRMWEKLTGMPTERSKGKGWILAIHPEDRDEVVTEWFRATKDAREFVMSFRLRDEAGHETPVVGQAFVMRNERGEALGHVGSAVVVQS